MLQPEDSIASHEKIDEQIGVIESSIYDTGANHGFILPKKEVLATGLISDLFDKTILETLEHYFESSTFRHNSLPAEEFKELISHYIPRPLVESVYRSIDVNDVGYVNYSDFTNYLIASEAGSSFSAKIYISRLVPFLQQEDDASIIHRDAIDCLVYVKRPCPMIITGGRDGQLTIWDPDSLLLMKNIDHQDKNAVYQEELRKSMNMLLRAQTKPVENFLKDSKMAITTMSPVLSWGMLCVGSADSCVTVYELSNQEVCGRITNLDTIPSAIECFQLVEVINADNAAGAPNTNGTSGNPTNATNPINNATVTGNPNNNNPAAQQQVNFDVKTFISIGDSKGIVHFIKLHPEFGNSSEVGMKKKNQILFAQSVKDNYSKMQVHTDWITDMHYIPEVNALITASVDSTMRFIDVARKEVTKTFTGHSGSTKIGIKAFRWSSVGKYIVSGADRTLLFWDPYTLEIMNRNDSLRSPLIGLEVCDPLQKVFAALSNKTILVWHNITLELLQSISDSTMYKPTNVLSSMTFVMEKNMMFTAGNRISAWTLEKSSEGIVNVDEEDLCTVIYNTLFNQILVVKALGTFKIYQAETGEIVRQFMVRPVDPMTTKPIPPTKDKATGLFLPLVLHACLDKNQTRLIVVGSNLSVQYWNIHDGSNLIQVNPQLYSTSLAHVYSNYPKSIVCITQDILVLPPADTEGSDYPKRNTKPAKLLLIGTEFGHVCVYQETQAVIEPIPSAFLRAIDHEMELLDHHHNKFLLQRPNKPRKISFRTVAMKAHEFKVQQLADQIEEGGNEEKDEVNDSQHPSRMSVHKGVAFAGDSIATLESSSSTAAHPNGNPANATKVKKESDANKDPVIWMHLIPKTTHLLTCYLSGRMIVWDLQTDHKLQDFCVRSAGAILNAMKMKNHKSSPLKAAHLVTTTTTIAPAATNINFLINTQVNNKLLQQVTPQQPDRATVPATNTNTGGGEGEKVESKENRVAALQAIINGTTPTAPTVPSRKRKESNQSTTSEIESGDTSSVASRRSHDTQSTGAQMSQASHRSNSLKQPHPPAAHRESAFARKQSTNSYQKNKKVKNSVVLALPEEPDFSYKNDPNYHPRLESMILAAEKGQLPQGKTVKTIQEEDEDEEEEEEEEDKDEQAKRRRKRKEKEEGGWKKDDDEYYNPDDHEEIILSKHRDSLTEEEKAFYQFKDNLLAEENGNEKKDPIKARLEFMKKQHQNQYFRGSQRKDSAAITLNKHSNFLSGMKTTGKMKEGQGSSLSPPRKTAYHDYFEQQEAQLEALNLKNKDAYNEEMKEYAKLVKQSIHSVRKWTIGMNSTTQPTTTSSSPLLVTGETETRRVPPKEGSPRLLSALEENSIETINEVEGSTVMNQSIVRKETEKHPHLSSSSTTSSIILPSKMIAKARVGDSLIESSSYGVEEDDEEDEGEDEVRSLPKVHNGVTTTVKTISPHPHPPVSSKKDSTASVSSTLSSHRPTFSTVLRAHNPSEITNAKPAEPEPVTIAPPVAESRKASITSTASSAQPHPHPLPPKEPSMSSRDTSAPHQTQGSGHSLGSGATAKIIVDFVVVLPETQIMIGACNDRYLRFFDMETLEVLCSCLYVSLEQQDDTTLHQIYMFNQALQGHSGHHAGSMSSIGSSMHKHQIKLPDSVLPDEVIRLLAVSDSEDVLVGGYNSGMIRVWSVHSYSVTTLRNLLYKYLSNKAMNVPDEGVGFGRRKKSVVPEFGENLTLAISPLALISEFKAHGCPILSLEYAWFDYEGEDRATVNASPVHAPPTAHNDSNASPYSLPNNRTNSGNTSYEQSLLSPIKRLATAESNSNTNAAPNSSTVATGRKKRHRLSDMGQEILEGYIVSAGLEQRIFLWTLYGKCVGEFGTFGWDINNETTWNLRRYNPYDVATSGGVGGGGSGGGSGVNKALASAHLQKLNKKKNQMKRYGNTISSVMQNLGNLMKEFPGVTNPSDLLILKQYRPKHLPTTATGERIGGVNAAASIGLQKRKYDFSAQNITKETVMMKASSSEDLLSNFFAVATQHSSLIRHQYEASREEQQLGSGKDETILPAVNNAMTSSGIAVKDMHQYVEKLTKKIVHRPPAFEEVNNEFHTIAKRHPIVPVNRGRKALDLKKTMKQK